MARVREEMDGGGVPIGSLGQIAENLHLFSFVGNKM